METKIGLLSASRIDAAVAVLQRAFMPDPIFSHFFPVPAQRAAVFTSFFDMLVNTHMRFGHVYGAERGGVLVGAAVWRPPDAGDPTEQEQALEEAAVAKVRAIDAAACEALMAGFAGLERGHPVDPHWYLFFVGIEPSCQGQRVGEHLLAPVLRAADAAGAPCYLETPFARTLAFYRRLGFDIRSVGHPFEGAPTLWTMLRSPR
jgi:ribosomal protein S18 acetylase RimI-like enzyme